MKDARDLFIDIRIELRKLQRDFHKTDLCKRLDEAIYQFGRPQRSAPAVVSAVAPEAVNAAPDAVALALAWQAAAQQLQDSEPAIHAELCRAVMQRLGLAALPAADADASDTSPPGSAHGPLPTANEVLDDGGLSEALLVAVSAGERGLTAPQREIGVGEVVVLSGFDVNPEVLIAKGDAEIARVLLELREREPAE